MFPKTIFNCKKPDCHHSLKCQKKHNTRISKTTERASPASRRWRLALKTLAARMEEHDSSRQEFTWTLPAKEMAFLRQACVTPLSGSPNRRLDTVLFYCSYKGDAIFRTRRPLTAFSNVSSSFFKPTLAFQKVNVLC